METSHRKPTVDERLGAGLAIVERVLIYMVALLLVGFAVLALVNTVVLVEAPLLGPAHDYGLAISHGIDAAFLTVILLELLHTVLSRGPISRQLQEFLVIGITSAVRHSLEIAAGTVGTRTETRTICNSVRAALHRTQQSCHSATLTLPGSSSRGIVIDLAINALGVLILVAALWLVRQQMGVPQDERMGHAPVARGEPHG
jgi:hypothetical protein